MVLNIQLPTFQLITIFDRLIDHGLLRRRDTWEKGCGPLREQ
jgi:hypothetical protein